MASLHIRNTAYRPQKVIQDAELKNFRSFRLGVAEWQGIFCPVGHGWMGRAIGGHSDRSLLPISEGEEGEGQRAKLPYRSHLKAK